MPEYDHRRASGGHGRRQGYGDEDRYRQYGAQPEDCPQRDPKADEGDWASAISDYLHGSGRLFMVELYVDAEPAQIERFHGQKKAYDLDLRPRLTVQTIHELQNAGVEPDVWKVEGLDVAAVPPVGPPWATTTSGGLVPSGATKPAFFGG